MTSKRLHTVFVIVLGLLFVGLLAGTYGVNKLLTAEADKLVSLKAKNQALDQEHIGLVKAKKDIKKYAELEKITRIIVPEDKSQAEAVREIVNIAAANGVSLGSISFPASTLGNNLPGAAAAGATATQPAPATPAPATKSLSQLVPVKNITGVYQLSINVDSDSNRPVAYSKFISFLAALERNRRTAQVSSITLQPDINNKNLLTFNLTLNGYIRP